MSNTERHALTQFNAAQHHITNRWVKLVCHILVRICDSLGEIKHISVSVQLCCTHCSVWDGYHPGRVPYSISISYSVTYSCAAALSHWSRPPGCTPGLNSARSDLENILNSNVTGLASTGAKAAKLRHLKLAWTVFLLDLVLAKVNFFIPPTLWQISQADVFSFHHMTLLIFPCGMV